MKGYSVNHGLCTFYKLTGAYAGGEGVSEIKINIAAKYMQFSP